MPVGRILNRFTADFVVVDSKMGNDLGFMLYQTVQLLGIIIAGVFVSPFMLLFAILLLVLCLFVASHFLAGAREVKRLESNCKSPIFEQFGSVLIGLGNYRRKHIRKRDAELTQVQSVPLIRWTFTSRGE